MEIRYPANKIFILFIIDHFVERIYLTHSTNISTDIFSSLKNIGNEGRKGMEARERDPIRPLVSMNDR